MPLGRHTKDILRLYLLVGLSMAMLALSFYLLGMRPLVDYLRETHRQSIDYALNDGARLLDSIIAKHHELARQTASRSAIRERQAAWLRGEVEREALLDFSIPKLADALHANAEMLGIARLDPEGRVLFGVGEAIPADWIAACDPLHLSASRGPLTQRAGEALRLVYCVPIEDSRFGRVGVDVLMMSDAAIQSFVDGQSQDFTTFAVVRDAHELLWWPKPRERSCPRLPFERYLAHGLADRRLIIDSRPLPGRLWLYSIVDAERFFAPVEHQALILVGLTLGATLMVFVLTLLSLRPVIVTLLEEERLRVLAQRDGLTGLYNHAYMQDLLDEELERARRYAHSLAVVLFDIDWFKRINDRYGHPVGDEVLREMASRAGDLLRENDRLARYGGEEFLVILPETGPQGAAAFAERLRHTIEMTPFDTDAGALTLTISAGVAVIEGAEAARRNKGALIAAADRALYLSKGAGRNRVSVGGLDFS